MRLKQDHSRSAAYDMQLVVSDWSVLASPSESNDMGWLALEHRLDMDYVTCFTGIRCHGQSPSRGSLRALYGAYKHIFIIISLLKLTNSNI